MCRNDVVRKVHSIKATVQLAGPMRHAMTAMSH